MTFTAVVLLLIAAVSHASWNLLGKRQSATPAFMLLANTLGCLYLAPVLLVSARFIPSYPPVTWLWIVVTGFFQAWYYAALAAAYRHGDLSIAYPLARSFPVIFVTLFTILVTGSASALSWLFGLGMLLVVAGSFILPMKHITDFKWGNYLNFSSAMALAAALGTAGYSIVDDRALLGLRQALGSITGNASLTITYAFLEGISSSLWLLLYVLVKKQERENLIVSLKSDMKRGWLFGFIIYFTYCLVLLAMAHVTNVSYVVAFRQLSIPLGALLGVALLKEPGYPPKFIGVLVMFAGLVLVGLG